MKDLEILLVEDNPDDMELTIRALKKQNLVNNIKTVTDGEQALEFIFATGQYSERDIDNYPKVILLDLKLPKIDGLQVLREIRKDERTKHIPVVILTSSAEERDIVEGYKLGVNSYIVKPVGFDDFVATVSQLGLYWLLMNKPPSH